MRAATGAALGAAALLAGVGAPEARLPVLAAAPAAPDSEVPEAAPGAEALPLFARPALGALLTGTFAAAFSGTFAGDRLFFVSRAAVAGFVLGAGFAAVDLEVSARGLADLLAEADCAGLAVVFTAGFAAVLVPLLAGALVLAPLLFPADAAMAGLWLVWLQLPL